MKFNKLHFFEYKDIFNIYNKIKNINPYYKLYYSTKYKCFIIVNSAKNNEICLNFNNFCANIEKTLSFTNIKNAENIFNFIDEHNQNIKQKNENLLKEKTTDALLEARNFCNKTSNFSKKDINKIIGESNA